MSVPPITVSIAGALPDARPLATLDINPAVESIQITKQAPGGFATLDLGFALNDDPTQPVPYLSQPIVAERRSHIVARIGGRIAFEGVPTFVNPAGQLQAEGYGLASPNWGAFTQAGDDPVDTRVILAEAVRLSPFLVPVQIDDPGGQRTWGEFQYQSPASVLNALTMAGDASMSVPLVFTVYEGRATRIVAAIPPDVPDYQVSYDPALMQIGWDYGDCIDGVAVAWTDAAGVQQITDTLYRDGVDAATAVVVPIIQASFPDAGAALQYATVYLAEHAEPRLSGTIRLGIDDLLQRPNGEQVPGYMVAAGEWISIGGQGVAPITSVTVTAGPVMNQQTGAVAVVSSVEIQVGSPPSSSWIAAQRRAMDAAAAYRAQTDANSGNKR